MLELACQGIDGPFLKKPFTILFDRKRKYSARIDVATMRGRNMIQPVAGRAVRIGCAPIIEHALPVHRVPSKTKIRQ